MGPAVRYPLAAYVLGVHYVQDKCLSTAKDLQHICSDLKNHYGARSPVVFNCNEAVYSPANLPSLEEHHTLCNGI